MKKKIIRYIFIVLVICIVGSYLQSSYPNLHNKQDRKGRVYWHGPSDENKIALTFDDGPSRYTLEILDILNKYKVKATFFVVGINAERFPDILKKEVQGGYAVGSHSYSHPDMQIELPSKIDEQFDKTEEIVRTISGLSLYLFRPPYGVDNPWVFKEAERRGYIIVKWSVSAEDWETKKANKIVKRIVNHVQNGDIILLHDGKRLKPEPDCQATVNALPVIIERLLNKGYQFVTVPELLKIKNEEQSEKDEVNHHSHPIFKRHRSAAGKDPI